MQLKESVLVVHTAGCVRLLFQQLSVTDSFSLLLGLYMVSSVLDARTQNGDEPVGEYSFLGQSCLSSADSC